MASSFKSQLRPVLFRLRSSEAFITFVVSFAVFTDLLLYGLIVPVTPTALHERVGLAVDDEQRWTSILLALYGVGQLACAPLAGYIADRIESRRWPFIVGLILLSGGCALLCVGTNLALLISGRLLQGASAAIVWAVGCALLVDSVNREGLGQSLGYLGTGMTMGTMLGPLLGGVLYTKCGYYAVFGLAFGLIGFDIVLRITMIERKGIGKDSDSSQLDNVVMQQSSATASSDDIGRKAPLGEQKSKAAEVKPEDNFQTQCPEQVPPHHQQAPLMVLLRSERIWVTIWGYFAVSVILSSFDSVLPLFVRDTFGWSQTGQGLIFLPLSIPHFFCPVIGQINDKYGKARRYLAGGSFLGVTVACVLLRFVSDDTMKWKVILCVILAVLGFSLAVGVVCLLSEAVFAVLEEEERKPGVFGKVQPMALIYGVLSSVFSAGSIAGPFLAGFIRESAGWNTMTWILGLVAGVSAIPMLLGLGGFSFPALKTIKSYSRHC